MSDYHDVKEARAHIHIVVVDDDEIVRNVLYELLTLEGYQVSAVAGSQAAIQLVKDVPVQVVITDLRLPGLDGIQLLERISRINVHAVGIVMTGHGTIDVAVKAMKGGAFDFITKPLDADAILAVMTKAIDYQRLRQENVLLKKTIREQYQIEHIVGTSQPIRKVLEFVEKVADSDSTVLIQGESGTGKELVARTLHFNSLRRDRPLIPVNCGAIPENLLESELFGHERGAFTGAMSARMGRFEMAHGGTIFLDEVAEMGLPLQVKLLRVLQERCFERVGGNKTINIDVRVIAATNQDLEQAVKDKRFRKDLFYRLNVIPVTLPPLRERCNDIPLLIDHFINRFNKSKQASVQGVERDAMSVLMQYGWPGNIREVENLVERLTVLKKTGMISVCDLPDQIVQSSSSFDFHNEPAMSLSGTSINLMKEVDRHESRLIMEAMRQAKGVTSKAAQLLQLNRTTLVEKLKRKGLAAKSQSELES